MTWKELLTFLIQNQIQLDESITVYDESKGEYYPVDLIEFTEGDDILDAGSIFLIIST